MGDEPRNNKVEITYFKPSGKYYATGEYETSASHIYAVVDEVRKMFGCGECPGLVHDSVRRNQFVAVVTFNDVPHIVRPPLGHRE